LTQLPLSERKRCAKAPPHMISTILFLAQQQSAPTTGQSNPLLTFAPLIFMFIIFYFLLIRPQQKRQKEQQKLLSSLKTGDKVITSSGIHGLIANVKETTFLVKIADNVKIEIEKGSIATVAKSAPSEEPKTAS
jgi:preprotein translocase subunit YajC